MSCPVVGHKDVSVDVSGQQPSRVEAQKPFDPPRAMSFRVDKSEETGKRVLVPTADGVDLAGVKACAVACNSDGTRTMTIELELE